MCKQKQQKQPIVAAMNDFGVKAIKDNWLDGVNCP